MSDDIMLMPWQARPTNEKDWQEIIVTPGEDYERAFNKPRPRWARLALATDTDDTGEDAVLWLNEVVLLDNRDCE